ncbi:hypothetical protein OKW21_006727 [Catalinimonas alkaloidigena]|uniref:hypothetical protein n=1 Tax=Catalinimonas alkaloidigena TaxID=1075417 RepID=UPI002405B1EC|nr:hypothetical protein [Catalinimonas alkaloidigena]MDF9795360.1 hypothetical protein [Catalinimonas alkaloidigena]MDF9801418.1 hypothetical protein [Catalinimonas alkaloidigena]
MRELDDPIWKDLTGGYQVPYDASDALKRLEASADEKDEELIWEELWNELYHQGDVGTASFLAIPQLVRIYKIKNRASYHVFAFITTIELVRINDSIHLPDEFNNEYEEALDRIPELIDLIKDQIWDSVLAASVLSATAIWKKKYKMAELIAELEDDNLTDYLLDQINEY